MPLYKTYLILGAPGSGKGTQGKTLGTIPRFFHFACGDVFRSLDTRTPIGRSFLEYSSQGMLVPDEITIALWRARIKDSVDSHDFKPDIDSLVLDGIPRNTDQAVLMQEIIFVRKVFHLCCPDRDKLVVRMKKRAIKENRLDDANESVILKRLEAYDNETKPLLDHYGPGMTVEINAMESPTYVLSEILRALIADGAGRMPEEDTHQDG